MTQSLTRRRFVTGTSALALGAALTGMSFGPAQSADPKKGGLARFGIGHGSTTDTLDPATHTDIYMQTVSYGGMRNCLTEIDNEGRLVPELAESWEPSSDARIWTFKLRPGVEFHNGKSLSGKDVVASLLHHQGKNSKSAAKPILSQVEELAEDGKGGVVITLKSGNADLPYLLSDYHLTIMPANEDGTADWQSGIGTGGYILKNFEPGVRAFLTRNPNYWKEGRAYFDEVEVLSIIDVTARTNALLTGEIHVMDRCDLDTLDRLKSRQGIEIFEVSGGLQYTMPMNTSIAPFDNNDVRLAVKHAINREDIVARILNGHGSLGNDNPITSSTFFYASDLPQRTYDPDKAAFHLKAAGYDRLALDLHVADAAFTRAVDTVAIFKEQASKAKIDINIAREPNDNYWSNVWMKKPWCVSYFGGRMTADWTFSTAYAAGAAWNDTFWNNDRFNTLLVSARSELDEGKRRDMYHEMQVLVRDDGGALIPVLANYVGAHSSALAHGKIGNARDLDGCRAIERWWFA